MRSPVVFDVLTALPLTACDAPARRDSAPSAPGSAAVTPANFRLPEGSDQSVGQLGRQDGAQIGGDV